MPGDRVTAGQEIAKRAPDADILVQVNVSGEPQKHGARPQDVPGLVVHLSTLGLDVRGLMAVGPTGPPDCAPTPRTTAKFGGSSVVNDFFV